MMAKYNTAEWRSDMKMPKTEKMPRNYDENFSKEDYMKMPRNYKGEDTFLMRADKYGKAVDEALGTSKGGKKGDFNEEPDTAPKKYVKGGSVGSASKRADGCAQRGKTRGKIV